VGATHDIPVNVRVVAATNEDVTALRDSGRLRPDLYYRLSAFIISVPPLRERTGDLPLLERAFLEEFTPDGKAVPVLDSGASMALAAHSWPGNVRELRHAIERGVTLCENGVVRAADLPPEICGSGGVQGMPQPPEDVGQMTLKAYLRMCERHYLEWVLRENGGDKDKCARILGISVATLYRKLAE
jgi:DNA-binding NtrC family response regulator